MTLDGWDGSGRKSKRGQAVIDRRWNEVRVRTTEEEEEAAFGARREHHVAVMLVVCAIVRAGQVRSVS